MTATHPGTPPRADHPEILDDRTMDPAVVRRSMRDVALSNTLFGGTRAVLRELEAAIDAVPRSASIVDVGTGVGDIPAAAAALARRRGKTVFTVGLDVSPALAHESRARVTAAVVADAGALPFRDRSVDVVTCSQLLHHFSAPSAAGIVREMDRVARVRVIVSDIRRSRLAIAGLWLASFALRFHPVSRHDGVASIRRGFSAAELRSLLLRALGSDVPVRRHRGFRVTAAWSPAHSPRDHAMTDTADAGRLGAMPLNRRMVTIDERLVNAPLGAMFSIARDVEGWPRHLPHYRYVRFREQQDGGGLVEMAANRPFWIAAWPTWWLSLMAVDHERPAIRFRHVGGITTGMDVEWQFTPVDRSTLVRIVHVWDGPGWPLIGGLAATSVIGPVFIHGIASRTLAGLATAAESRNRS